MNDFLKLQNDSVYTDLLKASTIAYSRAKVGENLLACAVMILSVLYPVAYIYYNGNEDILFWLFLSSFILTIVISVLSGFLDKDTSTGALIKEEFDVSLYGIRWKTTLTRVDKVGVSALAKKFKGEIKDWYPENIKNVIPRGIKVALCQRCNTAWDIELRKKYCFFLYYVLFLFSVVLTVCFVLCGLTAVVMLYILFSVLTFYIHIIDIIRGHRGAVKRRLSVNQILDKILENKTEPSGDELRDIQDEIYITRTQSSMVPDFFFGFTKKE